MAGRTSAPRMIRIGVTAAVVLAIASQIILRTFGAYVSESTPNEAVAIGIGTPNAHFAAAEEVGSSKAAAAEGQPPRMPAGAAAPASEAQAGRDSLLKARALVLRGLSRDPLSARGWRILGEIDDRLGDRELATASMESAARRSLRESGAHLWLLLRSYERKDAIGALARAETLLLSRSSALQALMPALVWIAGSPEGKTALDRLLATNPPWRDGFFELLPQNISDARLPLQLMQALKSSPHPATTRDVRPYLDLLLRHKLYELANYTWLQFLPPARVAETGTLYNGAFEHTPTGLPFDWVIEPGVGVTIDILPREDLGGGNALVLEFGEGRAEVKPVRQQILLAPGSYVFKGRVKGRLIARRGLQWRVACTDVAGDPIGRSQAFAASVANWTDFSFAFSVPGQGCRAQMVSLVLEARSASELLVQGMMSFAALRIERRGP